MQDQGLFLRIIFILTRTKKINKNKNARMVFGKWKLTGKHGFPWYLLFVKRHSFVKDHRAALIISQLLLEELFEVLVKNYME